MEDEEKDYDDWLILRYDMFRKGGERSNFRNGRNSGTPSRSIS